MPFFGPCLGTIQRIVRQNKHTKVVCIADNIIPHEHRMGDELLAKYFLNAVDGCVTMSKSVLEDLRAIKSILPAVYTPHPLYDNYGPSITMEQARSELKISINEKVVLFLVLFANIKD